MNHQFSIVILVGINNFFLQFELVCGNAVMFAFLNAAVMVGIFIGSTAFGLVADKYGRRVMRI